MAYKIFPCLADHLSWLSVETVLNGHSVLIFCPTKAWVEKVAESLAKNLYALGRPDTLDSDPASCAVRYGNVDAMGRSNPLN
jgi:hypothetical protein